MEMREFTEKIREEVQDYYGEEATVAINRIPKNNGVVLEGLTVMRKEKNAAPTIYLESFYERYLEGEALSDLKDVLLEVCKNAEVPDKLDMRFFTDYEKVKKKVVYKIIHFQKNQALLKEIPYVPYLDLAIVFYCFIDSGAFGSAGILIRNSHCEMWGVKTEEIYALAQENTPRILPHSLMEICEVLKELFPDMPHPEAGNGGSMYVLSNQTRLNGASCILYQNLLQKIAKKIKENLYILPSSVHEVILVPENGAKEAGELVGMVREVNETQVEEEEYLSDNVYFYNAAEGRISIVESLS